ncbi:MAG: aldo/keto reductase [Thaumarchaeota archaeon]|nr:aldo/keto reductase [Nitrososphaerota archaeon]
MTGLEKARVGGTKLEISRVGLGGGALGYMYQPVPDDVAVATVRKALEVGFNHVDTAPLYGRGTSESRVGEALRGVDRKRFTISTKVGRVLVPSSEPAQWKGAPKLEAVFDFSSQGIMSSFESSLERLHLKDVDILFIHDCDNDIPQALRESHPTISKLKEAGATKAIGAGLNSYETALKLAKKADFDCFLIAGRYTLLEQGALEEFLPYCEDHQIGVIVGGPFNSGILASDLSANAKYNYEDAPPELLKKARKIKEVCDEHSTPLRAAALQFILANQAVTSTIPGSRSPAEVEDNAGALAFKIPRDLWNDLKSEDLILEDAPVPR